MQTHSDRDYMREMDWLDSLKKKAAKMVDRGESQITAGKPEEQVLAEWRKHGIGVQQLPDDEHGVLRISIGGGQTPVNVNYCVFRGGHGECVDLLRRALKAMEAGPGA